MSGLIGVTGAGGFVGRRLCAVLAAQGRPVRPIHRALHPGEPHAQVYPYCAAAPMAVGDIGPETRWEAALADVDCVIHCAGRAHIFRETEVDALAAYRHVNVLGTRRLAEQAVAMGVKRLVFLSSIGVHGVHTNRRPPFSHADVPAPVEDYAISKWEAELELRALGEELPLEVVVVRPPLVYGPGAGGNFRRLLQLVARGVPLPFKSVRNRRSMVALDNLIDLVIRCVDHPDAAGGTFLVSDGQDLSLPEWIRALAAALGRKPLLFPVPEPLLLIGGKLVGRSREVERLIASLEVDIDHTRERLGWAPPIPVEEGLRRSVV
jgi:nucleoside-diphosphate-sugar epimerase